jgi:hypothetical protein
MGCFFESLYLPEDSSQEFAQNGCPERAAAAIVQSIMWTTRRPQRGQTDANRREPRIVQKSSVRLRGDGCKPGIAYPRRIQHPIEPMVRIELCGYAPQNAPKACYNLLVKWTKQPSERPESEGEWGQPQYPGPPARLKNSLADLSTSNSQPAKPPRWSTTVVPNGGLRWHSDDTCDGEVVHGFFASAGRRRLPLAGSRASLA